jgi:hypothetical protein
MVADQAELCAGKSDSPGDKICLQSTFTTPGLGLRFKLFAGLQPLGDYQPNYLAGFLPGKSLKFAQAVESGSTQFH